MDCWVPACPVQKCRAHATLYHLKSFSLSLPQALEEANIGGPGAIARASDLLPDPAAFPNLRRLEVLRVEGSAWLHRLSCLRQLQRLGLHLFLPRKPNDAELPPLASLTQLEATVPFYRFHIRLPDYPALCGALLIGRVTIVIQGGICSTSLRELELHRPFVRPAPLGALPALRRLCIYDFPQAKNWGGLYHGEAGTANISGATQLQVRHAHWRAVVGLGLACLCLGGMQAHRYC